jgi:hypothetical protein
MVQGTSRGDVAVKYPGAAVAPLGKFLVDE